MVCKRSIYKIKDITTYSSIIKLITYSTTIHSQLFTVSSVQCQRQSGNTTSNKVVLVQVSKIAHG